MGNAHFRTSRTYSRKENTEQEKQRSRRAIRPESPSILWSCLAEIPGEDKRRRRPNSSPENSGQYRRGRIHQKNPSQEAR